MCATGIADVVDPALAAYYDHMIQEAKRKVEQGISTLFVNDVPSEALEVSDKFYTCMQAGGDGSVPSL